MQKLVLSLDVHEDRKCRQRVMKIASSVHGVDQISLDIEKKKLTVVGTMDPINVVSKLRKTYYTTIDSIGPAKEPEKPKEKPKEEPKIEVYPYGYPVYPRYCYYY